MARNKKRKKKTVQPTRRKAANKPVPKSSSKQKLLTVVLIFAMVLFVLGGLFKSFGPKNNKEVKNTETGIPTPSFRHDGELSFTRAEVEVAQIEIERVENGAEINQGLMYRKTMGENRGMLFIMPDLAPQSFWMRNTFISLDIIFVDEMQKIVTIHKNTKPLTDGTLDSSVAAKYVVEVNAGYCDKYGIKVGDRIRF